MFLYWVLKVSGEISYSKASATHHYGTIKSYMFTHGQYEPTLSSRMQSCSWLYLDYNIIIYSSQHPLHVFILGPQSQWRYQLQQG